MLLSIPFLGLGVQAKVFLSARVALSEICDGLAG
jgi:hypothetical protein